MRNLFPSRLAAVFVPLLAFTIVMAGCVWRQAERGGKGTEPKEQAQAHKPGEQSPPRGIGQGARGELQPPGEGRREPSPGGSEAANEPGHAAENEPDQVRPDEQPVVRRATLAAVGDVLIHSSIYKDARTGSGYDFSRMFEPVKSCIEDADLAIANQESMIGGEALGLSDYPRFNSPFEVGDALKAVGFDAVGMANNHTMDRGEAAIASAIAHWDELGIVRVGAYTSETDRDRIRVVERGGIAIALLAYTYGTNGIPLPENKPYLVNLIDSGKLVSDIRKARELADAVVVQLHFGQEYADLPDEKQKQIAREAAEAGADIIIGHHPHVLQPMEWITTASGRKTFVAYSLGNFLAGQDGKRKRTGGILRLELVKTGEGENSIVEVANPAFVPTWIAMKNWRQYAVVPLADAPKVQLPDAQTYFGEIASHLKQWMPQLSVTGCGPAELG